MGNGHAVSASDLQFSARSLQPSALAPARRYRDRPVQSDLLQRRVSGQRDWTATAADTSVAAGGWTRDSARWHRRGLLRDQPDGHLRSVELWWRPEPGVGDARLEAGRL